MQAQSPTSLARAVVGVDAVPALDRIRPRPGAAGRRSTHARARGVVVAAARDQTRVGDSGAAQVLPRAARAAASAPAQRPRDLAGARAARAASGAREARALERRDPA